MIGPLPTTEKGNRFVLLVVDYFTKWVEAFALPNHTASTCAAILAEQWVSRYGVPSKAYCDQAPEFEGKVIADLMKLLQCSKTRTTSYRPISNGLAERSNQTIENIIRCHIREDRNTWDEALPFACMAYRAQPHASTWCSPNMMVYGRETNLPVDLMFPPPIQEIPWRKGSKDCYCEYVEHLREQLTAAFTRAQTTLKVAAERQSRNYHGRFHKRKFKPGEWVLYFNKRLSTYTLHTGWSGPYVIVRKLNDTTYEIQKSETDRKISVHCDVIIPDPWNPNRANWVLENLDREEHILDDESQNDTTQVKVPIRKNTDNPFAVHPTMESQRERKAVKSTARIDTEQLPVRKSGRHRKPPKRLIDEVSAIPLGN